MSNGEQPDVTLPELPLSSHSHAGESIMLTILYHPRCERIGEVCRPDIPPTGELLLGRNEPLFASADGEDRPLGDPYISRNPISLRFLNNELRICLAEHGSSVVIGRDRLSDSVTIPQTEIGAGRLLCLARRVVLLLHYAPPKQEAAHSHGLIGESAALDRTRDLITKVAATEVPVLLLGESGTGKELVARAIHRSSERSGNSLVSLNMAALPAELAAAELFGVRKGAYTGADSHRKGYFQRATGGSLFLDEIGDCPPAVQPQLLRALQEGEVQLAGGGIERVDVRVIAATDADIAGSGREFSVALRHRLGGFEIHIPPLRERVEDLGRLLAHALPELLHRADRNDAEMVSQWAYLICEFANYDWPGNVREFLNVCKQIEIATGESERLIVPEEVLSRLQEEEAEQHSSTISNRRASELSELEVREAMLLARWEVSKAARELEVSRQALYNRIQSIPGLRVAADIPSSEVEAIYRECKGELDVAAAQLEVSRTALRRRWRAMDLTPQDY